MKKTLQDIRKVFIQVSVYETERRERRKRKSEIRKKLQHFYI